MNFGRIPLGALLSIVPAPDISLYDVENTLSGYSIHISNASPDLSKIENTRHHSVLRELKSMKVAVLIEHNLNQKIVYSYFTNTPG